MKNSQLFFKVKHNIDLSRDWSYFCAPDVDLLEVTTDNRIVAYEIKGQTKGRGGEPEWPSMYKGLGQALAYLLLPSVYSSSRKGRLFDGGAFDYVNLVTARAETDTNEDLTRVLEKLTPLGYTTVFPTRNVCELVPPKPNPFKSEESKNHVLSNLATLNEFSETSRTFRNLKFKFTTS